MIEHARTHMPVDLRNARLDDAEAITNVYLRSRRELVACAPLAHSDEEIREWIRQCLIPTGRVTVAVVDGEIIGLLAVSKDVDCGWIDQLYLLPAWTGRGIGTDLLTFAQQELTPPIRLYTFQANQPARDFYERRGFKAIAFSDGSGNEEKCPDILYEWKPDREPRPEQQPQGNAMIR